MAQAGAEQPGKFVCDLKVGELVQARLESQVYGQVFGSLFGPLIPSAYTNSMPLITRYQDLFRDPVGIPCP